jgi:hypothetical protein
MLYSQENALLDEQLLSKLLGEQIFLVWLAP